MEKKGQLSQVPLWVWLLLLGLVVGFVTLSAVQGGLSTTWSSIASLLNFW